MEALAGGQEQFDRAIEIFRPRTSFLTDDQEVAVEFLREQFTSNWSWRTRNFHKSRASQRG